MKLFYITRVNIPSHAAQSVQISSMCEAFSMQNIAFKLISPMNQENEHLEKTFEWIKLPVNGSWKYLEILFKSMKAVLQERPTHIYTRDIAIAWFYSFFNITSIYEAHKEPKSFTARIMLKTLRRKNNFYLITISNALKDFYINRYNFSAEKILAYHDAVFIEKYDALRNIPKNKLRLELNLPTKKLIVMHTGSLYEGRGAELFEVILKHFNNIHFIQVGGTENDIKKWKEYYAYYDNIQFVKHQPNDLLIKYQMSADLLFYPITKKTSTWWCCSPMKIFEYMATGVPIIASNIGSVGEVLTQRNTFPFDPENHQTIIDALETFLNDQTLAKTVSTNALNDIELHFTWGKRAKCIIDFISNREELT